MLNNKTNYSEADYELSTKNISIIRAISQLIGVVVGLIAGGIIGACVAGPFGLFTGLCFGLIAGFLIGDLSVSIPYNVSLRNKSTSVNDEFDASSEKMVSELGVTPSSHTDAPSVENVTPYSKDLFSSKNLNKKQNGDELPSISNTRQKY